MRKKSIKSLYHWVVMAFVMLFPILLILFSIKANDTSLRTSVNSWASEFVQLDINVWYGDLLDAIGIGYLENSVMSVMYIYPLYVLWVTLIDLIVDILLVIPKLGHDALHRFGGDNE